MKWTLVVGVGIIVLGILFLSLVYKGDSGITGEIVSEPDRGVEAGITVEIVNFVYTPRNLEIASGETVTWINRDYEEHTVTAENGEFNSNLLERGQKFSYTFDTSGVYEYYSSTHPYIKGKIIVNE